jgi:hypothetical protein
MPLTQRHFLSRPYSAIAQGPFLNEQKDKLKTHALGQGCVSIRDWLSPAFKHSLIRQLHFVPSLGITRHFGLHQPETYEGSD